MAGAASSRFIPGRHRPFVVAVAGGSGSGKSTLVRALVETLGPERVTVIEQDHYYRDRSDLSPSERRRINYDHPDAIDEALLLDHLQALVSGAAVDRPVYDFTRHARAPDAVRLGARPCLIVEGILVLASAPLRALMDLKLFVDTDPDVRFIRRLLRDVEERGRTPADVIEQYLATVRPMHLQFVEPSRRHADLILPEGGLNRAALDVLCSHVQQQLLPTGRK
jgi:uridine kinase